MLDDAVHISKQETRKKDLVFLFYFRGRPSSKRWARDGEKKGNYSFSLLPEAVEEALGDAVGGRPAPLQREGGGEGGDRGGRSSSSGGGFGGGGSGVARARRRGRGGRGGGRGGRRRRRRCFRGQGAHGLLLRRGFAPEHLFRSLLRRDKKSARKGRQSTRAEKPPRRLVLLSRGSATRFFFFVVDFLQLLQIFLISPLRLSSLSSREKAPQPWRSLRSLGPSCATPQ